MELYILSSFPFVNEEEWLVFKWKLVISFFFLNKENDSKTQASIYVESSAQPVQRSLILTSCQRHCLGKAGLFSARILPCLAGCLWLLGTVWIRGPPKYGVQTSAVYPSESLGLPSWVLQWWWWMTNIIYHVTPNSILEDVRDLGFSFYKIILNLIRNTKDELWVLWIKPCLQCLYGKMQVGQVLTHSEIRLWMLQ